MATYLIIPSTPSFTAQPPHRPRKKKKHARQQGARRKSTSEERERKGRLKIGGRVYRGGSRRRARVATTTRRRQRRRKRGDGACPRPPVGDHHGLAASARRGARICRRSQRRRPIRGWEIEIWGSLSLMGEEEAEEQTNYCAQLQQLPVPLCSSKKLPVHFYGKTKRFFFQSKLLSNFLLCNEFL